MVSIIAHLLMIGRPAMVSVATSFYATKYARPLLRIGHEPGILWYT